MLSACISVAKGKHENWAHEVACPMENRQIILLFGMRGRPISVILSDL